MNSVGAFWVGGCCALVLVSSLLAKQARSDATGSVLVLLVSEQDRAAAERLSVLSEAPLEVQAWPEAHVPTAVIPTARARGIERVVILDASANLVHVVHTRDSTVLTRATDPARDGAYVAAFVAAELLLLSAAWPPPSKPAAKRAEAEVAMEVRLGADVLPFRPYRGAARPYVGLRFRGDHEHRSLDWVGELAAALVGAPRTLESESVSMRRSDLMVRGGARHEVGRFAASLLLQLGLGVLRAEYHERKPLVDRRVLLTAAAVGELELWVTRHVGLFATLTVGASGPRVDYRVRGASVLREQALWGTAAAGLSFGLPRW